MTKEKSKRAWISSGKQTTDKFFPSFQIPLAGNRVSRKELNGRTATAASTAAAKTNRKGSKDFFKKNSGVVNLRIEHLRAETIFVKIHWKNENSYYYIQYN